jgi:hypothetical protein
MGVEWFVKRSSNYFYIRLLSRKRKKVNDVVELTHLHKAVDQMYLLKLCHSREGDERVRYYSIF